MRRKDIFPAPRLDTVLTATLLREAHRRLEDNRNEGNWLRTDERVFAEYLVLDRLYYLILEHPSHVFLNRSYETNGLDLQKFIDNQIELDGEVGLDIWVLPFLEEWLIGCNHDNDIFASRK